jgi:uncharacterized membrane protein
MGLLTMIVGLAVFIGTHLVTTRRALRADLVGRFGEVPYKVAYSVLSLIGILLIAYGFAHYRATGWIPVWNPPVFTKHLSLLLVWPAIIFVLAAYIPGHIKRVLKHPMLVGVKLWAVAHLLSNGDLGSIILFGSILAWAVYDRISLKRRTDPGAPPIAIGGWPRDVAAVIVGTLLYLVLVFWFHPVIVGVPVIGR